MFKPKKIVCFLVVLMGTQLSDAQTVVNVGAGSYAEYPPTHEYVGTTASTGTFYDFATTSSNIAVAASKINEPIPTNDWWTSVLTTEAVGGSELGGNLWTYPLVCKTTSSGLEVGNRGVNNWSTDILGSRSLTVDYLVGLAGSGFTPTSTIALNWSDWHVDLRTRVGTSDADYIDITLAQGMPYVWAKSHGFDPIIKAIHAGVRTFYDASGTEFSSFPITTDRFSIEYDGNLYGVHFTTPVTITSGSEGFTLTGYEDEWVVFSALNSTSELNTLHQHAFVRPTDTKLNYTYNRSAGTIEAEYDITTDVISGTETEALQGFIPHHYRDNANAFTFSSLEYSATPRGTIKMASGNSFTFNYTFNADLLPHFTVPETIANETTQYDPTKLTEMIDDYTEQVQLYGISGGTYWGGKNLVKLLKYTLMAKESGNSNYTFLLTTAKAKVYDWLTYTSGETDTYYAYYPAWKALVGFNTEYGSGYFTDNHFHYGYLAHAGALLEMAEPGSMTNYWDMLNKVIKTYANWDRTDTEFPYLRTFSPWMGHSFASGLGNSIGNNQESSSESMQAWAGMFMVGELTGDTDMVNAAAFGYLTEGRAIADYWYNESGLYEEIGYTKPITGILEMNRVVYGTFFGAEETYIHGIQWLPVTPAFGFWNTFLTPSEANDIVDPIITNMETDLGNISGDWMNVSLGFKTFFDPEGVTSLFDSYWNSASGTDEYGVAHNSTENAVTYYYSHATQNLGLRQTNYRLSMPLSSAFLKDGVMTYIVYNSSASSETCTVYENGTAVTSFSVPGHTLYKYVDGQNAAVTGVVVSPSSTALTIGETQTIFASVTPSNASNQSVTWDSSNPIVASVSSNGLVTALNAGTTTITATTDEGSFTATSVVTVSMNASTQFIPGTIEGESFNSHQGVRNQTTGDTGGGLNVGWLGVGDYMNYTVDVASSDVYTVNFRVASTNATGSLQLKSGSTVLETIAVPNTGGWQNWTTVTATIPLTAGIQTLQVYISSVRLNFNWMEFEAPAGTCTVTASTGAYTASVSNDASNPTITFNPTTTGVGDPTCILFYGTSATGPYPGYGVTPGVPQTINAAQGATVYFYYTYSLPSGAEENTAATKHDFTVGSCATLKALLVNSEVVESSSVDADFRIYPNPVNDILKVEGLEENQRYEVYDALGSEMFNGTGAEIDVSLLAAGVYFVKIGNVMKEFVKQ